MKQRSIALINAQVLDQLCDLLIPKLEERLVNHLPSKQRSWVQIPPGTPDFEAKMSPIPSHGIGLNY